MGAMQAKKLPNETDYDIEEDEQYYVTRPHTSVRRYSQPPHRDTLDDVAIQKGPFIQRRSSIVDPVTGGGKASKALAPARKVEWRRAGARLVFTHRRPVIAIIVGMLLMTVLVFAFSAIGSWWRVHEDDVTYGRPRTFQINAVVGHGDSPGNPSHFIFLNLNRHVVIIELPGGDPTRARIYNGPTLFGDGQDLTPVTGEFRDVNGDGKPDMIVHIQDQTIVYINDGTEFRPQQPGDHVHL